MLWRDPVHKDRNLERWLRVGNFPTGIVEAALKAKSREPEPKTLDGWLFNILLRSDTKMNLAVGKLLKILGPYTDQADFLVGSRVPLAIRESREAPDGSSFKNLLDESDFLVIDPFFHLEDYERLDIDRRLASRAYAPPRITVILGTMPEFESVTYAFRNMFQKY